VITYASETWPLKLSITRKLLITERQILRRMFGLTKDRDDKVHEELKQMIN